MSTFPLKVRGLNVVLVAFSLLVLGGSAFIMSSNQGTNFGSNASNTVQSATGKLVKKGTPQFSPCKNVSSSISYALIGAQPETQLNAQALGSPSASPKATITPPACTPLAVTATLADPLVGDRVIATGTFTNGVFYATTLSLAQSPAPSTAPKARPSLPPKANPNAR